jgi:ABC-type polysaccharide/polyol phosphate export permease
MVHLSIALFFGLFAIVEIYQSVKNVQLPMPVYLVLGILLAIVSNTTLQNSSEQITTENNLSAQIPATTSSPQLPPQDPI